jgi:hypothetical protein
MLGGSKKGQPKLPRKPLRKFAAEEIKLCEGQD